MDGDLYSKSEVQIELGHTFDVSLAFLIYRQDEGNTNRCYMSTCLPNYITGAVAF